MDEHRIRTDYHALSSKYKVALSDSIGRLYIHDFPYPPGWQPTPAPFLIRYPQAYPRLQPAVYIPEHSQYTQGRVQHRLESSLDGWHRWCTHHMPWKPGEYELPQFLDLIWHSLNNPASNNPIEYDSRNHHGAQP